MDIWSTEATILFGIADALCVLILSFLCYKNSKPSFDGFYFRDVPKTDNPVQAVVTALSYRNPNVDDLDDLLPEEDLISFVILDCEVKNKLVYDSQKNTFDLKWNQLSDAEKVVFRKISLGTMGRHVLGDKWQEDCPFEWKSDEQVIIHLNRIIAYGEKIKSKFWLLDDEVARKAFGPSWHLVPHFISKNYKQENISKVYTSGSIKVSVFFGILTFPLVMMANEGNALNPALIAIFCYLISPTIVLSIAYLVERNEAYSKEDLEVTKQIVGLKSWILDFTNIKNLPPSADIVWGDFIKWGYLLGIPKQAIEIAQKYNNERVLKVPDSVENFMVFVGYFGVFTDIAKTAVTVGKGVVIGAKFMAEEIPKMTIEEFGRKKADDSDNDSSKEQ